MKYALVTGGSRGIGRAVCVKLACMAYSVIVNCVNNLPEALKTLELVRLAGQDGEIMMFDVSNGEQVRKTIEEWQNAHPGCYIEVLVNNAGITRDGLMMRMSEQQWDMVINVNLKSAFNFIHACTPIMMRQKAGSIINMASVVGVHGNAGQANYAASKAGIIGLTKTVAREGALRGIRCNAIAPGMIASDMTAAMPQKAQDQILESLPLKRFGEPAEIAQTALFLAQNDYVTGQTIVVDGGMTI